jgi:hypothetical protein
MERGTGLEPATICLEGRDSTTELPPLIPFTTAISDLRRRPLFQQLRRHRSAFNNLEPGTGIEPVASSLPRTRSTI